ncbi:MAG: ABC transporter ATP-binding protein [Akkermansiaceae bacterium]
MKNHDTFFVIRNANVWRGDTLALRNLSLSLSRSENVAILGANGAGKSSLLKLMTGEVRAEARRETICELFSEDRWSLEELRHRLGIVMPEEVARFHTDEIAEDVVRSVFRGAYGRTGDMRFKYSEREASETAMRDIGIGHLAKRTFGTLSSGEKRRFLIARSLVHRPEVLVLDEPSTALDFAARLGMLNGLRKIASSTGSVVLVTHDPGEILPEIERVILLKEGQIVGDGTKRKILTSEALSELYGMPLKLRWQDGWPITRPA